MRKNFETRSKFDEVTVVDLGGPVLRFFMGHRVYSDNQ